MRSADKNDKELIEELTAVRNQLMDLESQNKALLKSIPDLMFIINKDGIYTDYHASSPELLFAPPESFIGKNIKEILGPELAQATMSHIKLAVETELSQSFHTSLELSGSQHEFENRITPIDSEKVIVLVRDVTDQWRADKHLSQTKILLDNIILNLPFGVAILDVPEFRYLRINQQLADLNGATVEAHLGKTLSEMVPNAEEMIIPELRNVLKTGKSIIRREFSIEIPEKPTPVYLIDWHLPIMGDDGKPSAILSVVLDVTESRLTQAQLVESFKLASLGEMASGIAHEINQPLQVVRGIVETHLELSKRGHTGSIDNSQLKIIAQQVKRAGTITSQMRTFGRDAKTVQSEERDLNEVIREVLNLFNAQFRNRSIDLQVDFKKIPLVRCNHIQLEQVFINLLTNARDAMHGVDEKQIQVRTFSDSGRVFIEFEDNGTGISKDILPRVFDPFFTSKAVGKGTGLGLSISYGIVKDHGGEILIKETSKSGTVVSLELPY